MEALNKQSADFFLHSRESFSTRHGFKANIIQGNATETRIKLEGSAPQSENLAGTFTVTILAGVYFENR